MTQRTAAYRRVRRDRIQALAAGQDGVVGRRQLYALGLTRPEVLAEIRAGRWARAGNQCVRIGPPTERSGWRRALFEVGPSAVLDGVSALQAAGLQRIDSPVIHVAVPKSVTPHQCRGVRVHETRRYRDEDVLRVDIPRMQPATAAVHAALWAPTDAQAALFVIAAVQQRLTTSAALAEAVELVRRDPRRNLLRGLLRDVESGVQSFDERAFARMCRRRGLPEPSRQVMRIGPNGRVYFDVMWEQYGVIVEIDGIQHLDAPQVLRDALKQNVAAIDGALVLRIPNWALRSTPGPFLDQVEAALRSRGWNPSLRPANSMQ